MREPPQRDSAQERIAHYLNTPPHERAVIVCRACGSARADHVSRDRLRCPDCGAEDVMGSAFAVCRSRWLLGDLERALESYGGGHD